MKQQQKRFYWVQGSNNFLSLSTYKQQNLSLHENPPNLSIVTKPNLPNLKPSQLQRA